MLTDNNLESQRDTTDDRIYQPQEQLYSINLNIVNQY